MATHPDPPCLTLARAIFDLLEDSGASVTDMKAALSIVETLLNAEYSMTMFGGRRRHERDLITPESGESSALP